VITFQVEKIKDIKAEALPLLQAHWEEIALNKDSVPLDPDWDGYVNVEAAGLLHIITARDDSKLIGYAAYFITPNLHYRSLREANSDIFYLSPEHRKGLTGLKLMKAAEVELKAIGVNKIINKVKKHFDLGPLFERIGYKAFETHYAKLV